MGERERTFLVRPRAAQSDSHHSASLFFTSGRDKAFEAGLTHTLTFAVELAALRPVAPRPPAQFCQQSSLNRVRKNQLSSLRFSAFFAPLLLRKQLLLAEFPSVRSAETGTATDQDTWH